MFLLLLCRLPLPVQGQGWLVSADTTHVPDWLRTRQQLLSLPQLPIATHVAHFRLSAPGQVVEGWRTSDGSYSGQVLNWVQEVNPKNDALTNRIHRVLWALDSATVRGLFDSLQQLHLRALPDETAIVGWKPILDGISYTLEYATTTTYAVKSYGNPASQGTLPEAQRVLSFVAQTVEAEATLAQRRAFEARIPYQCYTDGGGTITCRILTAADQRKYKREQNGISRHRK
ncbi:hypothetical protein MTX78_25020 (plasmid) [Hymenobacter tibetensis]|uniref:Uncharacterized protein n=1 Tax=Hymenobacter tibetensis TaxID=497967 RepID=A0ABY4D544_9BACT|nr:hypothetical protein [Hymenobacter tibetensis]UOG77628.1 hypothetical protein MTX78_25020 [Hymenobacter tibetensis]